MLVQITTDKAREVYLLVSKKAGNFLYPDRWQLCSILHEFASKIGIILPKPGWFHTDKTWQKSEIYLAMIVFCLSVGQSLHSILC